MTTLGVGLTSSTSPRLLDEFEVWASREGPQVSTYTAQRYRRYAAHFLAEYGKPQHITTQQIESWRGNIANVPGATGARAASASTVNVKLAALKTFFDFCVARGMRRENPVQGMSMLPVPQRLPRPIEQSALDRLFDLLQAEEPSEAVLQDRAILETLFGSGLRREEAATLTMGSVIDTMGRKELRIIGKGNKERITVITRPQYEALKAWVLHKYRDERSEQLRAEINDDAAFDDIRKRFPDGAIFWSGTSKPLTEWADPGHYIWKRTAHWFKKAGIDGTTHQLRHSFGTYALDGGADIRDIQELMGHGDIRTTAGYTKTLPSTRLRVLRAHPRG